MRRTSGGTTALAQALAAANLVTFGALVAAVSESLEPLRIAEPRP